jgi:outer membrane protein TolC
MGVLMLFFDRKNRVYINTYKVSSFAIVFLSLALVACGSVPRPDLNAKTPSAWRNSVVSNPISASNDPWWASLKDPVLNDAVELALKNNLSVAQSYERLNSERALEKATLASHKPKFGFYFGPNSSVAYGNYRTSSAYLLGFDFSWEFPYTSKKDGERQIAQANVDMAFSGIIAARTSLVAEVVRVYGELRAADQKVQSLKKILAYQQGIHEMFERSLKVGAASQQELSDAHSILIEAQSALLEMNAIRESAVQRLDVLCGLESPLPEWLNFDDSQWGIEQAKVPPFAVPVDVIMQRPDVQASVSKILHAAGSVGIADSELYPKLGVEGAIFYSGTIVRNGSTAKDGILNFIAPSLRFPIWDWGMAREQKNASEAELRRAILSYRDTVLQAIAETEITIANFNAVDERMVNVAQEALSLEVSAKRNKEGLSLGYLSPLDAFRGQVKLLERKLTIADEQSAWLAAFAAANKAQTNMTIEKARMAEKPATN